MSAEFGFRDTFATVFESLISAVADFVPRALMAIVVILVGLLLAKLAEKAIRVAFERFKINALLERVGITETLRRFGMTGTPGRLLSRSVYFLLIILFTQSVTQAVGLTTIANAIGAFFTYLPSLVAAFLVLLLGMIVAQFLGRTVTRSATDSGMEMAPILGRIVSTLVFFVTVIMSLSQLRIDTDIVRSVVLLLLGGVALAIALSFGLGARDVTRNLIAGFYARKLFRVGEMVEIRGERGVLAGVTAIQTLVEQDGETLAFPNQLFLDEVVKM